MSEAQLHNYPQKVVALRRTYALAFLQARHQAARRGVDKSIQGTSSSSSCTDGWWGCGARDSVEVARELPHSGSTQLHKM